MRVMSGHTDRLIEWVGDVVQALLVELLQNLLTMLELLAVDIVDPRSGLPRLLGSITVREVLGRRGMDLALRSATVRVILCSANNGDRSRGSSYCHLLGRRGRGRRGCELLDDGLGLVHNIS